MPAGSETDFILLSCAGVRAARSDIDSEVFDNIVRIKRAGEEKLRCSGLSYTIIRPGPIIDEPGGYKALVFDQVPCSPVSSRWTSRTSFVYCPIDTAGSSIPSLPVCELPFYRLPRCLRLARL